jgi:hypothetical protein
MARVILTLQAAEISKGRTVSQEIPYCHPQANPHEGSTNLTMYMVNAPLIGYMTANSASACIIRYLHIIVSSFTTDGIREFVHHTTYQTPVRYVKD